MTRIADAVQRARLVEQLRTLADFLDARPELPLSPHACLDVLYFPGGDDEVQRAEVRRVAGLLGTEPVDEGEHLVAQHRIGRAAYRAVAIPEQVQARYRALLTYTDRVHPD